MSRLAHGARPEVSRQKLLHWPLEIQEEKEFFGFFSLVSFFLFGGKDKTERECVLEKRVLCANPLGVRLGQLRWRRSCLLPKPQVLLCPEMALSGLGTAVPPGTGFGRHQAHGCPPWLQCQLSSALPVLE